MYTSEYLKMYYSEEKLWWYVSLRSLLRFYLGRTLMRNPFILDAGCGTGKNLEFLKSCGYKNLEGFDYSQDAVDFCKKRGLEQIKQASILEINYPDESFDVVYCMDVLGCLVQNERTKAVSELFRVLKKDGILICNSASLNIFKSQHDDVGNIKIRFNKNQFIEMFKNHNYQITKLTYRVFLLSPLVFIFKLIKNITRNTNKNHISKSDQIIFPFGINWFLKQIQLLENQILKKINLPFGSSLFIVLIKK